MREWLARAREDLEGGAVLAAASLSSYGLVSFLAQQAAEKALKAFLTHGQIAFGKTHNLEELLRLAEPVDAPTVAELFESRDLSPHAVDTRYPGGPVVEQSDAERHLALARRVVETIERRLGSQ